MGKLSGAVGTYSNIDPAVEAHVCRRPRARAGAGHPGHRPGPPRRVPLRLRLGRGHRRARSPPRSGTWPAARSARSRSRSRRARRAARPCPTSATRSSSERLCGLARVLRGYLGGRARGRRPVARAGHLAQLGRAGGAPRRLAPRLLRAAPGDRSGGRGLVVHPDRALAQPDRGVARARLQPVRAPGPGGRRPRAATPPTGSSSATPGRPGPRGGRLRAVLEADPEVTLAAAQLDEAFDLGPLAAPRPPLPRRARGADGRPRR